MFSMNSLLWLIAIPLLGGLWIRTSKGKWTAKQAGIRATLVMGLLWSAVIYQCAKLVQTSTPKTQPLWQWLSAGEHQLSWALSFDSVTAIMTLLISTVGFFIHLYSIDYMKTDRSPKRYFAYLNLFVAMMMTLVLADGLILMFIGWEGVGLCSYLLIGYYYGDHANANAGKKAFVINRVGDLGLIIAMMGLISVLYPVTHEIGLSFRHIAQYAETLQHATLFSMPAATVIGVCLFIGVTGKSAQIPLYIWLPDAMAGPTPVSALIHAATMVTAGVYLLIRCAFIYEMSWFAPLLVAWTGGATLLLAAMMAVFQKDIKKVLAYSTVSQLGYMVMACGLGGHAAALFHVWTHGFFKALLFLAAGFVIHALGGQQNMDQMGGLRKKLPWTFALFVIGSLALVGVFPLAGFFSKDHILLHAWSENKVLFTIAMLGVFFTAFYTIRMVCMTFGGSYRGQEDTIVEKGHALMILPMVVLAIGTVIMGWLWTPHYLGHIEHFYHWVTTSSSMGHTYLYLETWEELIVGAGSMALAILGMWTAWHLYKEGQTGDQKLSSKFPDTYELLFHQFYADELYERAFVYEEKQKNNADQHQPPVTSAVFRNLSIFEGLFDRYVVDGLVHWFALVPQFLGQVYTSIQNGQVQNYLRWITLGAISILLYWFAYRGGPIG